MKRASLHERILDAWDPNEMLSDQCVAKRMGIAVESARRALRAMGLKRPPLVARSFNSSAMGWYMRILYEPPKNYQSAWHWMNDCASKDFYAEEAFNEQTLRAFPEVY